MIILWWRCQTPQVTFAAILSRKNSMKTQEIQNLLFFKLVSNNFMCEYTWISQRKQIRLDFALLLRKKKWMNLLNYMLPSEYKVSERISFIPVLLREFPSFRWKWFELPWHINSDNIWKDIPRGSRPIKEKKQIKWVVVRNVKSPHFLSAILQTAFLCKDFHCSWFLPGTSRETHCAYLSTLPNIEPVFWSGIVLETRRRTKATWQIPRSTNFDS